MERGDPHDEEGATAAEYALMAALVAMAIIAAVAALGQTLQASYECSEQNIASLDGDAPGDVTC